MNSTKASDFFTWVSQAEVIVIESFHITSYNISLHDRKKKKNKDKKKIEEAAEILSKVKNQKREEEDPEDVRTPAQIAYDKIQEKRVSIQYNETHSYAWNFNLSCA